MYDKYDFILDLPTTKAVMVSRCLLQLCLTRLVMSVVLNTAECTGCNVEVLSDSAHGDDYHDSSCML